VLVTLFRAPSAQACSSRHDGAPVAATLGAMGLLRIPLDPGSAMVAAVVLGISGATRSLHAVPATRGEGLGPSEAIEERSSTPGGRS
jgi:predicted RND superfamily exporter protein